MKILIIEDEDLAAQMLQKLIKEVEPEAEILAKLQSIEESVDWLENNPMPDLMFADIHLADGSAFVIFENVNATCPVVFTTAYDEYALKAFEVNSIDYLLKPINREELVRAFNKFHNFGMKSISSKMPFTSADSDEPKKYKSFFLVPSRDRLIPMNINNIAYVYTGNKNVKVTMLDKSSFTLSLNMDEIMSQLDPTKFFRANRQFIVSKEAIKDLTVWFGSRLALNLRIETPEAVLVSKARVNEFKEWFIA